MVAIGKKPKFDPAAHLHKQGWQGKGTALKQGHSTRPLAVVQKKTLSGIGRDRDEAVPFWDHIFAATAASLFSSPSGSASPAPSTGSWAPAPLIVDEKGNKLAPAPGELKVKPKLSITASARAGRELARRGLYSRFLRGEVIVNEPEDDLAWSGSGTSTPAEVEEVDRLAGPVDSAGGSGSHSGGDRNDALTKEKKDRSDRKKDRKGKGKETDRNETKEERRARRAEKARRKADKERQGALPPLPVIVGEVDDNARIERRKKRKERDQGEDPTEASASDEKDKRKDKKRIEDPAEKEARKAAKAAAKAERKASGEAKSKKKRME
ncbi:hypothetical protein IAU60_003676 [Kwoniella sp. DSM 27419]